MAKIYSAPSDIPVPQYNGDLAKLFEDEQLYVTMVSEAAQALHSGDIVGEVVRFAVGDGAAQYVVWNTNPCELVHLTIGDAWGIPTAHARGLRTKDLRDQLRVDKLWLAYSTNQDRFSK